MRTHQDPKSKPSLRDGRRPHIAAVSPHRDGGRGGERIAVEDKRVFTTPWIATMTYGFGPAEWMEQVCAENIQWYSGQDAEVPRATKPDF